MADRLPPEGDPIYAEVEKVCDQRVIDVLDRVIATVCDCGDFDGHPGDCAATPIINLDLYPPPTEEPTRWIGSLDAEEQR